MGTLFTSAAGYTGAWPWPNFSPGEIACPCCGELYLDTDAMDALQGLRNAWGNAIRINSAHRCARHNAQVGGAANSMHLRIAFDCHCPKPDQADFIRAALAAGFTGIGGSYANFVHLDRGRARRW